ncbi:PEP-CTERM sorting domain-containing protein [Kiritimatiellaeota bacterium B1221]|nr:PEP-CTERM sorting domain-containing protein [Kiritimatiellaeota bacterium B1221]
MKTQLLPTVVLSAVCFTSLFAQTHTDWNGGGASDIWSDAANWSAGTPDTHSEVARYLSFPTIDIEVDSDHTINSYLDGFDGAGQTTTISGTGVLTIDRNLAGYSVGINNATGGVGGTLKFGGKVTIDNSLGGATAVQNSNGTNNITEFAAGSTLTLNTNFQVNNSGSYRFNGTLAGSADFIAASSPGISFGVGHDSSGYTGNVIYYSNGKVAVDGGTVLRNSQRFQVNGNNSELELNAADAINGAGISIAGTNTFLLDANADQDDMGFLNLGEGTLNLDLAVGVTDLSFADSSAFDWTGGTVNITGFREGVIKFGNDDTGLTAGQLNTIDDGIYSLTAEGYLTIPEPGTIPLFLIFGSGLLFSRRQKN